VGLGEEVEFDLGEHGEVIVGKASSERRQERFGRWRGFSGPGASTDEIMAMTRGEDR
jgi:hypothetical protein